MRLGRRDDRARSELVQVGPADPADRNADDYLLGGGRARLRDVLDPQIACGMEAQRAHQGTIFSARRRSKSETNDVSVSRTSRKPSRRLRDMSVKVSIVRPRS